MATIAFAAPGLLRVSALSYVLTWGTLSQTGLDDGAPLEWNGGEADVAVQASGTFGVGGSVTFEGSILGTVWFPLTLRGGTSAATFTAAGGGLVQGAIRFIRPRVTAGDGTTALVCSVGISPTVPRMS